MTPEPTPASSSEPGVVGYPLLCLTALFGMVLVLMERERDPIWVLFLAGVGAVGVMARWRAAPPLLLLGLAVIELYYRATWSYYSRAVDWQETMFTDVALCAVVLAYSLGQYRLVALTHSIFPIDARRRPPPPPMGKRPPASDSRQRRSPLLPSPWEIIAVAITAASWAVGVAAIPADSFSDTGAI